MKPVFHEKLCAALTDSQGVCRQEFSDADIRLFCAYYDLVLKWNPRLHLTTITDPFDFAHRHLCESAVAGHYLTENITSIYDLGSGMGIPGIPLAILYPQINVHLIDADSRKAVFLKEAADILGLRNVTIENSRVESLSGLPADCCLIVRAIENMQKLLSAILSLGQAGQPVFVMGGASLQKSLQKSLLPQQKVSEHHLPFSAERFLYVVSRETESF